MGWHFAKLPTSVTQHLRRLAQHLLFLLRGGRSRPPPLQSSAVATIGKHFRLLRFFFELAANCGLVFLNPPGVGDSRQNVTAFTQVIDLLFLLYPLPCKSPDDIYTEERGAAESALKQLKFVFRIMLRQILTRLDVHLISRPTA